MGSTEWVSPAQMTSLYINSKSADQGAHLWTHSCCIHGPAHPQGAGIRWGVYTGWWDPWGPSRTSAQHRWGDRGAGEGHGSLTGKPNGSLARPLVAAWRSVGLPQGMVGRGGWHGHTHSCLLGLLPARVNPWIVGLEVPEALRGGCAYRCEFLECRLNKQ